LLGRVREVALGAYAHQDVPFETLVEALQPERDLSRTPLFQVMLNLHNFPSDPLQLPGLTVQIVAPIDLGSKVDLTLYAREAEGALQMALVYNPDLFEGETIRQMRDDFHALLERIVADPERCFSQFPVRVEAETQLSARPANTLHSGTPFVEFRREEIEQSIPARFQQQVERFPERIAVRTNAYEWSYQRLNQEANFVVQTVLSRCGVGEEQVVLLFTHDAPMVAALLGVLKAGKAYVPLDPTFPPERLASVMRDARAGALLTERANLPLAKAVANGRLPLIDFDAIDRSAPCHLDPCVPMGPDSLAYLLYTSGSTGEPKGIVQNHRNVLHFIRVYTNALQIHAEDRLTLLSSYGFDAAVMDLFAALLNGASLHPIDLKEAGLTGLADRLVEDGITLYHSTPSVYRCLVDTLTGQEDLHRLRLVVLGGEEARKRDLDLFQQHFPPECRLVNGLGPTESTVTLQSILDRETKVTRDALPVGYPVEDTEILLLNEAGKPAPVFRGEIAIRSRHVALGYWEKAELTRAAFLPEPVPGDWRIYRTGDLGRRLPDGSLQCLGRVDAQVKIRGYRVEPGEIEARLLEHPSVRAAVVLARETAAGEKCLVAYVVPVPGDSRPAARSMEDLGAEPPSLNDEPPAVCGPELRQFLKQRLPEYMVPSAIMFLEALPLTRNGKLDRRALSSVDQDGTEREAGFVAPRTPVEEALAAIWAEVLGQERVGVHDNFFELGGHSLLATQVITRIARAFNVELSLRRLFEVPTVAGLTLLILESLTDEALGDEIPGLLAGMEELPETFG
jgi:amino acid adenylation domain-containing protein